MQKVIRKIVENPIKSYALYSLADRTNWQGKFLNFFTTVPDFDETPLGYSQKWLYSSRSMLIDELEIQLKLLLIKKKMEELNIITLIWKFILALFLEY